MAGPWEAYAKVSAAQDGPWTAYAAPGATQAPAPDPTGSFLENVAAGAGKAVVDAGRGAKQMLDVPAKWLERKLDPAGRLSATVGMPSAKASAAATEADVAESRKLDAPLMDTGGGLTGNIAGNVVMAVAAPGATTYKGAAAVGGALGALQPTVEGESRIANTAIGAGAGVAGKFAGDKIAGGLASRLTSKTAQAEQAAVQNVPRDTGLAAAREAGAVLPPRMVQKQGVAGSLIEGFGGRTKLEQQASNANQKTWNTLARKTLGLSDDTPITPEVLAGIRSKAGEAYEALRGAGTITADKQFGSDLSKIMQKYQGAAKDFPDLAKNEIGEIVSSINKPQFSADSAIDAISILRERAATAFAKGDKGVGSAYRQTSQAMEDAIERNLLERGNDAAVKAFQAARKIIAKTYSIEKALGGAGDVSAPKLAGQLAKGKPLTDELRTIAEFARSFPKAAQDVGKVERYSVADAFAGSMLGVVGGLPAAAIPLARPAARSLVLSPAYQALMASPEYGTSAFLRSAAGGSKVLPRLLPGVAAGGAIEYAK